MSLLAEVKIWRVVVGREPELVVGAQFDAERKGGWVCGVDGAITGDSVCVLGFDYVPRTAELGKRE